MAMLNYQRVNLHFPMVFLWFSYIFRLDLAFLSCWALLLALRCRQLGADVTSHDEADAEHA